MCVPCNEQYNFACIANIDSFGLKLTSFPESARYPLLVCSRLVKFLEVVLWKTKIAIHRSCVCGSLIEKFLENLGGGNFLVCVVSISFEFHPVNWFSLLLRTQTCHKESRVLCVHMCFYELVQCFCRMCWKAVSGIMSVCGNMLCNLSHATMWSH